jgi:hypothetical protein
MTKPFLEIRDPVILPALPCTIRCKTTLFRLSAYAALIMRVKAIPVGCDSAWGRHQLLQSISQPRCASEVLHAHGLRRCQHPPT